MRRASESEYWQRGCGATKSGLLGDACAGGDLREVRSLQWVSSSTASGRNNSTHVRTTDGRFVRPTTRYRNWVTADGSPGPTGEGGFAAARGRYHLYVALSCPWAHRTVIFRVLKGLEDIVSMSVVEPIYGPHGWKFGIEPGHDAGHREWHKRAGRGLPSRRSALHRARDRADAVGQGTPHYRQQRVGRDHPHVQRGVRPFHRRDDRLLPAAAARGDRPRQHAGLREASTTASIAPASPPPRRPTTRRSARCSRRSTRSRRGSSRQRYLAGAAITEADWRLFTTLVRFDAVYYSHFKCNLRRIVDYPNLSNYLRDLYQQPGIAGTVNMDHIKTHYYGSQLHVNPRGIVPRGPLLDFTAPHDRGRFEFLTPRLLREAVEQAVAAGGDEIGLAAAARHVRGIPGLLEDRVGVALAVDVAEHRACRTCCCVQLLQVRLRLPANALPSMSEPVSMSCMLGVSPRILIGSPFSSSAVALLILLLALCRSSTLVAMTAPLAFCHGPLPIRSRALTVALGLRRVGAGAQIGAPGLAAGARRLRERWQCASAPARPPRSPPLPGPTLVTKKRHVRLAAPERCRSGRATSAPPTPGSTNAVIVFIAVLP